MTPRWNYDDFLKPAEASAMIPAPGRFVMCPVVFGPGLDASIREFYRLAYEQTLADWMPSRVGRGLVPSWN